MKRIRHVVLGLCALAAAPLFAVCTVQVNVTRPDTHVVHLAWAPVQGATQYYFEWSTDAFSTTQRTPIGSSATSVDFVRTNSAIFTAYSFRITAVNDHDPNADACTGTATANFIGDLAFRIASERMRNAPSTVDLPALFGPTRILNLSTDKEKSRNALYQWNRTDVTLCVSSMLIFFEPIRL